MLTDDPRFNTSVINIIDTLYIYSVRTACYLLGQSHRDQNMLSLILLCTRSYLWLHPYYFDHYSPHHIKITICGQYITIYVGIIYLKPFSEFTLAYST